MIVFRGRVVLPDVAEPTPRDVVVEDGRIASIEEVRADRELSVGDRIIALADDEVLLPGLVDTHVHVNEPGRTEWEGFATATRAAAAGGVTTLVDMPLNSIPATTSVEALEVKRAAAEGQCFVDVGFWGGAVPGNLADLAPLTEAGVVGFKCFLLDSGVAEFPPLSDAELEAAAAELRRLQVPLIVHAEDAEQIADPAGPGYADFLASRPGPSEGDAVARLVEVAEATGCLIHVVHVSGAEALDVLAAHPGVLSAETCPHYLTLTDADVDDDATEFKCCPPIRTRSHQDRLWAALRDGTLRCVVSDHSPATADLKLTGDFRTAWGGIASLQLGLALVWTEARARGIGLSEVVTWMATRPAELVRFGHKGRIAVGGDADLVVFAPDERWTIDAPALEHRNPVSPYHGREVTGRVRSTWLAGNRIEPDDEPRGRLLRRKPL
ncbi:allantoinase AllB [Nocardioides sp. GY 10113]|uniref:allantoinase AllB n=1 Tax=Nocardioides sp. GY 10113 TaxID=2569761 RepID=UPI0010A91CEF|nr:allantoinase AllB [Nocardioides sp. GY 10113]TIC89136.1 allantoinase AllB [Nocardioides sp. GY 10113]